MEKRSRILSCLRSLDTLSFQPFLHGDLQLVERSHHSRYRLQSLALFQRVCFDDGAHRLKEVFHLFVWRIHDSYATGVGHRWLRNSLNDTGDTRVHLLDFLVGDCGAQVYHDRSISHRKPGQLFQAHCWGQPDDQNIDRPHDFFILADGDMRGAEFFQQTSSFYLVSRTYLQRELNDRCAFVPTDPPNNRTIHRPNPEEANARLFLSKVLFKSIRKLFHSFFLRPDFSKSLLQLLKVPHNERYLLVI